MPGDNDDTVLLAGKFRNDVVDGKLPYRRLRCELVLLNIDALQLAYDVLLQLGVSRTSRRTRAKRDHFLHVLQDVIAVDVGPRGGAGGVGGRCPRRRRWRGTGGRRRLDFSGCLGRRLLLFITSHGGCRDQDQQTGEERGSDSARLHAENIVNGAATLFRETLIKSMFG